VAPPLRLLTGPLRVTEPLRQAHLATLVSADALARWARAGGREVQWRAATLAGDLGGQSDLERELAREGLDRAAVGREAFVDRVRALEADGRARAQALLDDLGAVVDLRAGAIDDPAVVRAARTAFVRLYDAGRLTRTEQVVDVCPRCETVVDPVDSDEVETAAIRWKLRLAVLDDPSAALLPVAVVAPELLQGAVAVAVPVGHPARGARVPLPVAGGEVPVVAADVSEPTVLVPAHDQVAWSLARPLGLAPIEVLDGDGVVRIAGPLEGLARFAAREQAAVLLAADLGALAVPEQATEISRRCRRCRTVVVPRLGRHWMLAMADCEVAAADIVRDEQVTFHPPSVAGELIAQAGGSGAWCLSRQVWAGQSVPIATCLDCCHRAVAVDMDDSCGKCMGRLIPDDDVLDARFVAAIWPLAVAGWPDNERIVPERAAVTVALAAPSSVGRWVLPSLAVALAVAGVVPFAHVAVLDVDLPGDDRDEAVESDVAAVLASDGLPVARAALVLAGRGDLTAARRLVAGLADMPTGDTEVAGLAEAVASAYRQGAPGTAACLLTAAMTAGIPSDPAERDCVRRLAGPIVGK
jgi:valyl-tRNA synthetase